MLFNLFYYRAFWLYDYKTKKEIFGKKGYDNKFFDIFLQNFLNKILF